MTILTVPLSNSLPYYKFQVVLSGVTYSLVLRYNGRMSRWIMNINDSVGNQILSGLVLLTSRVLYNQYTYLKVPDGPMAVSDQTGLNSQPTRYSFGLDKILFYVDPTQ